MNTPNDNPQAQAEQLLQRLDNAGLTEYLTLSQKTGRILWLNFISGIARGLGFSIGATLVLAVVYKILARKARQAIVEGRFMDLLAQITALYPDEAARAAAGS